MRIACVIFIIFIFNYLNLFSQNNFDNLKSKCDLQKYEYMIVVFIDPGNCSKCEIVPQWLIQCISQRIHYRKFKPIALLRVNRDKELKQVSSRINWNGPVARDDRELKKQLNITLSSDFAVIDHTGKLIFEANTSDPKQKSDDLCEEAFLSIVK